MLHVTLIYKFFWVQMVAKKVFSVKFRGATRLHIELDSGVAAGLPAHEWLSWLRAVADISNLTELLKIF